MRRRVLIIVLAPLAVIIALSALAVGIFQAARVDELQLLQTLIGEGALPDWLHNVYGALGLPLRLIFIIVVFGLAWLVTRISWRLAGWLLRAARYEGFRPLPRSTTPVESLALSPVQRRHHTVQLLLSSLINVTAFVVALVLAAGQFVSLTNLAVVATILANAFGFAARDFIGDILNGIGNIFDNRFDIGDNVSIFKVGDTIEGIVEKVSIRTLSIRTRSGELIVVPQGEVRTLRNYSRGSFTGTTVACRVNAADLPQAMAVLLALAGEATTLLSDLLEPWTIVSRDGALGEAAEVLIHAKARYGRGAELRLRIMTLVSERLQVAGIDLAP